MFYLLLFIVLGTWPVSVKSSPVLAPKTSLLEESDLFEEGNNSESQFWDESANLIVIENNNVTCNGFDKNYQYDTQCTQYYRCEGGNVKYYQCVAGFLFDVNKSRCLPQQHVRCSGDTGLCIEKPDGYHPDSSNSKRYLKCCSGSSIEVGECPDGKVFSVEHRRCRLGSQVADVEVQCHESLDTWSAVPGSNCRRYYRCYHGNKTDFECPRGQLFDREVKACSDTSVCYEPLCIGKINGIYPDTTTNCERGFNCVGGHVRSVEHCPPGERFSHRTCAPASAVQCQQPQQTAVQTRQLYKSQLCDYGDGYKVLLNTNCQQYVGCLDGIATSYECQKGQKFNGTSCSYTDVCSDFCSGKRNGYYADEYTGCRQYYYCVDNKMVERKTCPEGSLFSGTMCLPAALTTCESKPAVSVTSCRGLNDGYHPDYLNSCKEYFYCAENKIIFRKKCAEGEVWNGYSCVHNSQFLCKGPEPWDKCKGFEPGLYQDQSLNSLCKYYHYCYNGNRTVMECPDGQVFNNDHCVSVMNYTCPSLEPSSCVNKQDGYYTSDDCKSYFYCSNGYKNTFVCNEGEVHNGEKCVQANTYTCPHTTTECTSRRSGYYPDEKSQCTKYYYCHKGSKYVTLTCSKKKIFNGERCINVNDVKTECQKAVDNTCRHETDGFIIVPTTNCQKYQQCKNGNIVKEYTCKHGTLFNGTECVADITCDMTMDDNICSKINKTGYIQQLSDNCRSYYFCIGKSKLTITCPNQYVFNGRQCVDPTTYTCPNILQNCSELNVNSSECMKQYQT